MKFYIPSSTRRAVKLIIRNIRDSVCYYKRLHIRLINIQSPIKNKISSVIFVCKGNVCRSAFAEQRLRDLLLEKKIIIDSCGINVDQGGYPPEESISIAAEFSSILDGRRAKRLQECDINSADLICPMEYWQYQHLVRLFPRKSKNIILLRNLTPFPYRIFCNIPDPYGSEAGEYRRVFTLIDKALQKILEWC